MAKQITWVLEDHLCKGCGGRILRAVSGVGVTPGGNPVFRCADCGVTTSSMGPQSLCWCGFSHRQQHHMTAYRCLPFAVLKERPNLEAAFRACGCDPRRGEIGVVLERDMQTAENPE